MCEYYSSSITNNSCIKPGAICCRHSCSSYCYAEWSQRRVCLMLWLKGSGQSHPMNDVRHSVAFWRLVDVSFCGTPKLWDAGTLSELLTRLHFHYTVSHQILFQIFPSRIPHQPNLQKGKVLRLALYSKPSLLITTRLSSNPPSLPPTNLQPQNPTQHSDTTHRNCFQ